MEWNGMEWNGMCVHNGGRSLLNDKLTLLGIVVVRLNTLSDT